MSGEAKTVSVEPTRSEWIHLASYHREEQHKAADKWRYDDAEYHKRRANEIGEMLEATSASATPVPRARRGQEGGG